MNAARILQRIATIEADLADLKRMVQEESSETPERSPWMTVKEYAGYARVSRDTVRRWCTLGMRDAGGAVGLGKLTRIHRDVADAWRKNYA